MQDIKDNLFYDAGIVNLDKKDPNYKHDLANSCKNLEDHFLKLVDDLILKEYNYERLCKDETNIVKLSVFVNMLNLYHIYVALIRRKKDLLCACSEGNVTEKIKNGKAAYLFENSKSLFSNKDNDARKYYVLDLETLALRVNMAFNPSEPILTMLEDEENKSIKGLFVHLFKKQPNTLGTITALTETAFIPSKPIIAITERVVNFCEEGSETLDKIHKKIAKDYTKFRFVKDFFDDKPNSGKNDIESVIKTLTKSNDIKINNINVFKKFISEMMNYNFGDKNVNSTLKEKKLCVKLDFILSVVNNFCDSKIFPKIQEWLVNDYPNYEYGYGIEFSSVKNQIESLLKNKKSFRVPGKIILHYILESNFSESYTLSDLDKMFKIVQDRDNTDFKIEFIRKIIGKKNKTINAGNASDFMEIVNFFVQFIASLQVSQSTNLKTDKKAKIDCSKLSQDLLSLSEPHKRLLAAVLRKINISTLDMALNIGNNVNVLAFIMDLDNECDNNFDIFAVFVEKFRFEIDLNDKNVKDKDKKNKDKEEIKCLVQKMINILYLRYKNIRDDKAINQDSITVFANTVKYFYGNFLYAMVENKIDQYIAPDDFTHLIEIVEFLSEKKLLQKIIDSGDVAKQKPVLQIESLKDVHKNSVIISEETIITENQSSGSLINKNQQSASDLRNQDLAPKQTTQASIKLDKLSVPANDNVKNIINENNTYPKLDKFENSINIINDSGLSSKNINALDETMSKITNKFDIHQINYDLCKTNLINCSAEVGMSFTLYDLYRWYKYFIENRHLDINSLQWYKLFLMCGNYVIKSKIAPEIDIKLLADLLINVYQVKEETKEKSWSLKTIDFSAIKNILGNFTKYINYCFEDNNLQTLTENMNRLIKFAEAILSLYIEPQGNAFRNGKDRSTIRLTFINSLTDEIDILAKKIQTVFKYRDRDDDNCIYCKYSLSKLILIIKGHCLQFESTKQLDYLNRNLSLSDTNDSIDKLKEDYQSAKDHEHLRLLLSYFDELEKKWEYKKGYDIKESDIKNDIGKSNIEHVQINYKKSNSALDYSSLENELTDIKKNNQRLLVELFKSNVEAKSYNFIQQFSLLKIREEKLYAITAKTKKLWEDKDVDTFFPLAFYLVEKFYEIFRIKYEYCESGHGEYKDVVSLFSGYVYEYFWNNLNVRISQEQKKQIENVLVEYFDQLVYADYFKKELPKFLDERKNSSNILKELPQKINKQGNALSENKKNDQEIQHDLILSKLNEYDDSSWEQAKRELNIKTPDDNMSDEERNEVEERQNLILEATKKTDKLCECLYDLFVLIDQAADNSNSYGKIIQDFLEKDNPTCNISNCEFLFGEGGKLRSEFENKKNSQLNDLNIDRQLSRITHKIIFNEQDESNNKKYVSCANINAYLEEYTKSDDPKQLDLDIKILSQNIARGIVFKQSDDPTDLFKSIQKIYAKNNNTDQYKIRLDDVFEIIKIMFLDEIISQKLINMLIDNSLFEQKSLSTKNLKTLAQIVELKNKDIDTHETKHTQNQNLNNGNGKTLNDFMDFIFVKHPSQCLGFDQSAFKPSDKIIKCDASTFFDCVVLFYRKKINHDGQTIGKFTTQEINQILNTFCSRCDDWIALCNFVKYNWDGFADEKEDQRLDEICLDIIHKANSQNYEIQEIAISEFLKSLMHPIEILHKRIKENQLNGAYKDIYQWTFISGMVSIDSILRSCGSKIDISNIINKYASFLDDCIKPDNKDKFSFLTDEDYRSIFRCLADLLSRQGTTEVIQYIAGKTVNAILKKAQTVKFPVYKLYRLIEFVHSQDTDFKDLTLFNYFKIKQEDYDQPLEAQSARKAMKHVIIKHLQVLPSRCLLQSDFDTFRNELLETDLRLNVDQFILYLQLAGFKLIKDEDVNNENTRFSLFDNCLDILSTGQTFDFRQQICIATRLFFDENLDCDTEYRELDKPVAKINSLDLKKDLVPMFRRLRCKSKDDFNMFSPIHPIGYNNEMCIRLSIAKNIANASVKKFNNDIDKIIDVLKQFNDKEVKIKTKDLEEIFKYYGLSGQKNQKLAIYENGKGVNQNNLNLLLSCVKVLLDDQFKLQDEMSNNKTKDVKTKNDIASCCDSPAINFLKQHFTHDAYGTLQMGNDAIIKLIGAALSNQNESKNQPKQDLVLNLLWLFWTPVYDNTMLDIDPLLKSISNRKQKSRLNDPAFTKKVAVMYFVKHLYSLLLTIGQEEIGSEYYQDISTAIQTLQQQLSDYNNEPENKNRKISKDDISDLYKAMIGEVKGENKNNENNENNESKSHLPKVNLQAKLFEDIKDGILDLITYDDDNNDKNKNPKIIISFAILHAINNADDKGSHNYNLIFKEVIKSGAFGQDNKCDLEMLKFVFDQMLGREDNQNDQNRLSISFNDDGQKLFDTALGCLKDNGTKHSEIFDFLQDYFIPNGQKAGARAEGWLKRFFSRLQNLFRKKKDDSQLQNNNDDYLKPENFKPKKRESQDSKGNPAQDNNVTEKEFKLRKKHVEQIMAKSKNRFLFYSSDSQANNAASQATGEFLAPYKDALSSEMIVKYISKFKFQDLPSFEDFMKEYWMYDKLFCEADLDKIYDKGNFEAEVKQESINFCVTKLMLMNKLKNGNYDTEENKPLLAYLAKTLKEIKNQNTADVDVSVNHMQSYCLEFCNFKKDDTNNEDQEKIDKINREIELLFGFKKQCKNWGHGLLIALSVAVILSIILYSNFNAYLLIAALIFIFISGLCIKNLFDIKKFNNEQQELENLGETFNPQEHDLYIYKSLPSNDYPTFEEIDIMQPKHEMSNYQPDMIQSNENIINTNSVEIPLHN